MKHEYERGPGRRLFDDYLDLGDKYAGTLSSRAFGFLMVKFVAYMLADVAPSIQDASKTIEEAVQAGFDFYREEGEAEVDCEDEGEPLFEGGDTVSGLVDLVEGCDE